MLGFTVLVFVLRFLLILMCFGFSMFRVYMFDLSGFIVFRDYRDLYGLYGFWYLHGLWFRVFGVSVLWLLFIL